MGNLVICTSISSDLEIKSYDINLKRENKILKYVVYGLDADLIFLSLAKSNKLIKSPGVL